MPCKLHKRHTKTSLTAAAQCGTRGTLEAPVGRAVAVVSVGDPQDSNLGQQPNGKTKSGARAWREQSNVVCFAYQSTTGQMGRGGRGRLAMLMHTFLAAPKFSFSTLTYKCGLTSFTAGVGGDFKMLMQTFLRARADSAFYN